MFRNISSVIFKLNNFKMSFVVFSHILKRKYLNPCMLNLFSHDSYYSSSNPLTLMVQIPNFRRISLYNFRILIISVHGTR